MFRYLVKSSTLVKYNKSITTFKNFNRLNFKSNFTTTTLLNHGHLHPPKKGEELYITFVLKDGSQKKYAVSEGDSVLDIAQGNNLDMEGACGGSCACSTCHVIVDPEYYDKLEEPTDDEDDMLDLAYGLTETSRLGCCIHMNKDINNIRVALPQMTRNVKSSDFE
ncbi:mitochondrial matrix iron-sulfur protein [Hanseniaspora valbyensis]